MYLGPIVCNHLMLNLIKYDSLINLRVANRKQSYDNFQMLHLCVAYIGGGGGELHFLLKRHTLSKKIFYKITSRQRCLTVTHHAPFQDIATIMHFHENPGTLILSVICFLYSSKVMIYFISVSFYNGLLDRSFNRFLHYYRNYECKQDKETMFSPEQLSNA